MLGVIDFTAAKDFEPVPAGDYPGQTKSWEAKPTKNGDSHNIEAKFVFEYTDPESQETKNRTHTQRWNLKPQALWRIKRDLIAMGADPDDLKGNDVNLAAVLNDLFGAVPTPVMLSFEVTSYTPEGATEPRMQNELVKVVAR